MVLPRLVEAHCVPKLTYAIKTIHLDDRDELIGMSEGLFEFHTTPSSVKASFIRRQFASVTNVRHTLGRLAGRAWLLKRIDTMELRNNAFQGTS